MNPFTARWHFCLAAGAERCAPWRGTIGELGADAKSTLGAWNRLGHTGLQPLTQDS